MSEERVQILNAIGFPFKTIPFAFDRDWEIQYDAFVDWTIRLKDGRQWSDPAGIGWVRIGGWRAAKLAVWATIQRELYSKKQLPEEFFKRLNYFNFVWKPKTGDADLDRWIDRFAQLAAAVESYKASNKRQNRSLCLSQWILERKRIHWKRFQKQKNVHRVKTFQDCLKKTTSFHTIG